MIPFEPDLIYCFKSPLEKQEGGVPIGIVKDESKDKKEPDRNEYILCRQCNHVITSQEEHISVDGAHQHTFANPHGILFEIGCFRTAVGCGYTGHATDDFTWFKGFSWRIAVCGSCITHVGWFFVSSGNDNFNGLILDRLTSPK